MDSAKKRGGIKCKHHLLLMAEEMKVLKKIDSAVSVQTICETHNIGSPTMYIKKKRKKWIKFLSNSES